MISQLSWCYNLPQERIRKEGGGGEQGKVFFLTIGVIKEKKIQYYRIVFFLNLKVTTVMFLQDFLRERRIIRYVQEVVVHFI